MIRMSQNSISRLYHRLTTGQKLLIILLFALALRLYVVMNAATIAVDSATDLKLAEAFTRGRYLEGIDPARPPLHPFLVSLLWYLTGELELAARLLSLVCGVAVVLLGFLLARRLYDERVALVTAFFIAIHPYLIRYSGETLREAPYHLIGLALVLVGIKGVVERRPLYMFYTGVLSALAYLNKHAGLGFLMIFSLWIALHRPGDIKKDWHKRAGLILSGWAVFMVGALFYLVFLYHTTGGVSITAKVNMSEVLIESLRNTFTLRNNNLWDFPARLTEAVSAPFVVFMVVYFVHARRRGLSEVERFVLFVAAVYLLVHLVVLPERRYIVRLMPLVMPMVAVGFCVFADWLHKRYARGGAAVVAVVAVIIVMQMYQGLVHLHAHRLTERLAGRWILNSVGEGTTVVARRPVVSFYARAEFVFLKDGVSLEELQGLADGRGVYLAGYRERLERFIRDFHNEKKRKDVLQRVATFNTAEGHVFEVYRVFKR